MQRIIWIFVFAINVLVAMDDPAPYKTSSHKKQAHSVPKDSSKKKSVTFLSSVPSALGTQLIARYAEREKKPRDNRQDMIIERAQNFGNFASVAQDAWDVELDERPMVDDTVAYMRAHPAEQSHFKPNVFSVTTALPLRQEKIKQILLGRMESFPTLSQDEKNKVVVDAIKVCPCVEVIKPMIDGGATVHAQDADSRCTLLHFAARNSDIGLVTFLLERGAHIDATDRLESTPLHTAVDFRNYKVAKLLAKKTEQINLWDWSKNNALYYAVLYNDIESAKRLLKQRACIYYYDTTEEEAKPNDDIFTKNVLAIAVAHNNLPLLTELFKHRNNAFNLPFSLEAMVNAALITAAQNGNHDIINFFLCLTNVENCPIVFGKSETRPKITPDLVFDEHSAIGHALVQNHFWVAYKLLSYSKKYCPLILPHCRASRRDSLRIAVQKFCELSKGNISRKSSKEIKKIRKIISTLLDEGAEPASGLNPSAAFIAAKYENKKILNELLMSALAHDDRIAHNRLLFELAKSGCAVGVRTLLPFPVSARIIDIQGDTPLHKAVLILDAQNLFLIDDLISAGADIAAKNLITQDTPLHKAMKHPNKIEQELVVKKLIEHLNKQERVVEIDSQNKEGNTPLMSICSIHNVASNIIQLLVTSGAGVHKQNVKGQTPLFIAASKGSLENVKALLDAGADPNQTNFDGCGPLTKAAKHGTRPLIDTLIDAGANFTQFKDGMLRTAAKGGHIMLMKWLLHHRANINGKSTSFGSTPLHRAVQYRQHDAIEFLLQEGADANERDSKNNTPLDIAIGLPDQAGKAILSAWINRMRSEQK